MVVVVNSELADAAINYIRPQMVVQIDCSHLGVTLKAWTEPIVETVFMGLVRE